MSETSSFMIRFANGELDTSHMDRKEAEDMLAKLQSKPPYHSAWDDAHVVRVITETFRDGSILCHLAEDDE